VIGNTQFERIPEAGRMIALLLRFLVGVGRSFCVNFGEDAGTIGGKEDLHVECSHHHAETVAAERARAAAAVIRTVPKPQALECG